MSTNRDPFNKKNQQELLHFNLQIIFPNFELFIVIFDTLHCRASDSPGKVLLKTLKVSMLIVATGNSPVIRSGYFGGIITHCVTSLTKCLFINAFPSITGMTTRTFN